MIGGMIGGQVAAETIKNGEVKHLREYEKRWHKRLGWRHEVFYNIRYATGGFDDKTYNNICDSALKLPEDKRTLAGIFRAALWNQPSMILDVAKVFMS